MKIQISKQKNENYTIIIGCGRLGANLANTLSDNEEDVLIIDKNKEAFRKLSPAFGGLTLNGDATDLDILLEAQIGNATAVIAVTNNDNANILVAQIAREIFHIERVIARLYDPEREYVYHEFGIDTICPAVLSVKEIDKILSRPDMLKDTLQEAES
ncbi:potassium channel family protein [Lacrimispora defluvii]|uniref:TrkA family potassium uptake protein n=1 Tax=Lacrimispora defluvii TaxID=2719233 RepID=A0ABX1VMP1_9FIRM|nr:TrkA family potassium uptake protein [Lacrimispora defluvii]NNJ29304.1 TrkA family potassium uptake protein [Lacrimispora defluvii]